MAEDVPRVAAGGAEPGAAASPPPELGKAPGGGMFSIPHSVLPERPVLWPSRTVQGAEEGRGGWGGAASLLSVRGSRSRCGAAGTAPPADADPAATYRGRGGGPGGAFGGAPMARRAARLRPALPSPSRGAGGAAPARRGSAAAEGSAPCAVRGGQGREGRVAPAAGAASGGGSRSARAGTLLPLPPPPEEQC